MKKVCTILIIITVFIILPMVFLSHGVNFNQKIALVEEKIELFRKENLLLESQLASKTSCAEIFENAQNQDFVFSFKERKESVETVALVR